MNKLFLPLFSFLVLYGCMKSELQPTNINFSAYSEKNLTKTEILGDDNVVSEKDIESYLLYKELAYGKKSLSVTSISEGEDTLCYVINYEEGWEILSGDKRAPVLLAYGDRGSFTTETDNVEMLAWLESLVADVQALKHLDTLPPCTDEQLSNMHSAKTFWALINCEDCAVFPKTRFNPDDYPESVGHWELKGTTTSTELFDSFRLMQTHWGQSVDHYNEYCPLKTSSSDGSRAPAGCVAVAGAQMLYYLHFCLSVPTNAPDTVFCSGYVGNGNYYQFPGGSSSTTWNYMLANALNEKGYYSAAVLIADVGKKVGMAYGNDGSSASTSNLPSQVFSPYGISCTYVSYNSSTTSQSLLNGMPVIVRAYGTRTYVLGLFPKYSDGHSFIIDGYRRYRKKITYQYEWEWDEWNGTGPIPYGGNYTTVSYGSPYITDYRMNWGWSNADDDSYFAPSGNWGITFSDGSYCNFIYQRNMIHDFSISE